MNTKDSTIKLKFNIGDIAYDYAGRVGVVIGIDAEYPNFVDYKIRSGDYICNVAENNLHKEGK